MRQPRVRAHFEVAPTGPPPARLAAARSPRRLAGLAVALATVGTLAGLDARAQAPSTTAPAAAGADSAKSSAGDGGPLARYVPKDNLVFMASFDGLDAHAEAWQKTAAYKMLNTTPLGVMLEEVAAQLLDRALEGVPNRRLNGTEAVALLETILRKGWLLSFTAPGKGGPPPVAMLVFRGMAAKETRLQASRALGMLMGADKPRTERRKGRFVVLINAAGTAWWAEKDDIVIGPSKEGIDYITDVLDGKVPSAVEHPVVKELSQAEGTFRPVLTCFMAESGVTDRPLSGIETFVQTLHTSVGVTRLDYRWGFDDDALMSVLRLNAPSPRKPVLALFDQPRLDTKQLIPIPDGVDSFVTVSASPAKLLESIAELDRSGQVRGKIDELLERIKGQGKLNIEKDLLGNLGPRMTLYLAPGRSAAATDEAPKAGLDLGSLMTMIQPLFPKPTLVAEIRDPVAFNRALDATVIAINKELKAMAVEKAATLAEAGGEGRPGQAGAPPGQGNDRSSRRRSNRETPAPELRLAPGAETVKTYMLVVPPDSPIKLNIPGLRPTIRQEGKFVAIASTSEAARVAIDAVKKKDWKPSADIDQALGHTPPNSILLAVDDLRSTAPGILANLPGTIQMQVNTTIAVLQSQQGMQPGQVPGGYPGASAPGSFGPAPSTPPGGSPGGRPGLPRGAGGRDRGPNAEGFDPAGQPPSAYPGAGGQAPAGYPGSGGQRPPGYPGAGGQAPAGYPGSGGPQPGGAGNAGGAPAMMEIKVDPSKLPKAEDLKALMFPGTCAVSVDDKSIRIVIRESFPNPVTLMTFGGGVGGWYYTVSQAAQRAQQAAGGADGAGAAPAPGGPPQAGPGSPGGPASPRGRPGGPAGARGPGGRGMTRPND
ncbi:hypothetical protein OJF2_27700 [Aquisphaera giovannonii]|uniref:Uncharacterized protein n=1 Tax=Aquisphaera giovannonii TaxID=406548 RepID=A0A5B9W2H6_9BACT|nr:hypothetical protein [Aquisphaera giovannonii]QEH34235.1 hypothetical protein OJF2_27700 [Aquisphaera giovannonii]